MTPAKATAHGPEPATVSVVRVGAARLPTSFGEFQVTGYRSRTSSEEFVALHLGDLGPDTPTLVRIHSQCLTSESFGSVRCDCNAQLEAAMHLIQHEGIGVIVYQFQEGRGIGILSKIRAYALQDAGADTVEANEILGFPADLRVFDECAAVLRDLNVRQVRLISNNPAKMAALSAAGIRVLDRVSLSVPVHKEALPYLKAKKQKLGHWLPDNLLTQRLEIAPSPHVHELIERP